MQAKMTPVVLDHHLLVTVCVLLQILRWIASQSECIKRPILITPPLLRPLLSPPTTLTVLAHPMVFTHWTTHIPKFTGLLIRSSTASTGASTTKNCLLVSDKQ